MAASAAKAEEQADGDLCDENPQNNAPAAQVLGTGVADNSRQSLLLMRGPRAVHGLYDFLLNDTGYPGLGKSGSTGVGLAPGASAAAAAAAQEDVADLPMLLAPAPFEGGAAWRPTIKLHHAGYSVTVEAEAYSIPLNSTVLEQPPGDAGAEVRPMFTQGGAVTLEELIAWHQPVVLPAGRPVKGMTCSESQRLSVRL
eukprot:XP_001693148.1 predicted protein [Chlamydomonas reinhardtii]